MDTEDTVELQGGARAPAGTCETLDLRPGSDTSEFTLEQRRRRLLSNVLGNATEPRQLDHYVLLEQLGEGGMGVVHAAYDRTLDRKVAIKMLHAQGGPQRRARLVREAKALAKLSHQNVVHVYEIREHELGTFIVMDYVDGVSLRAWLAEAEQPLAEIIDVFISAGRGLAALHAAGLVHRDFKPDNVMIRGDGQVLVMDLGLAHGQFEPSMPDLATKLVTKLDDEGERLTRSGGLLGTPLYMAPEQFAGESVTAKTDQFSFCVALWEAVNGERPFVANTLRELMEVVTAGVYDRPAKPDTPAWLTETLQRGLAIDPEHRFDSMAELLDELSAKYERNSQRRRRVGLSLVTLAMVAAGWLILPSRVSRTDPCAAVGRDELSRVWDERRREALEQRFDEISNGGVEFEVLHELGVPLSMDHVRDSELRVFEGLDRWASAWANERAAVCRAPTAISTTVGWARGACLARERRRVETLVERLQAADSGTLARAVVAVASLPEPSSCAGLAESTIAGASPVGDALRVDELRAELDHVQTLRWLGHYDEALRAAQVLAVDFETFRPGPIRRGYHVELGLLLEAGDFQLAPRALDHYRAALEPESGPHEPSFVGTLLLQRVGLRAFEPIEPNYPGFAENEPAFEELVVGALESGDEAEAGDPLVSYALGRRAEIEGQHSVAIERYTDAITNIDERGRVHIPVYLGALARAYYHIDHHDEARALLRAAVAAAQQRFGPRHPVTAKTLFEHSLEIARRSGGAGEFDVATQILAEVYGDSGPQVARAVSALVHTSIQQGEIEDAERYALMFERVTHSKPNWTSARAQSLAIAAIIATLKQRSSPSVEVLKTADNAVVMYEADAERSLDGRSLWMRTLIIDELLLGDQLEAAHTEAGALEIDLGESAFKTRAALALAEVELRLGNLDVALEKLQIVEASDISKLGSSELSYHLLRALVDLRRGELDDWLGPKPPPGLSRNPSHERRLQVWLDKLKVTDGERRELTERFTADPRVEVEFLAGEMIVAQARIEAEDGTVLETISVSPVATLRLAPGAYDLQVKPAFSEDWQPLGRLEFGPPRSPGSYRVVLRKEGALYVVFRP